MDEKRIERAMRSTGSRRRLVKSIVAVAAVVGARLGELQDARAAASMTLSISEGKYNKPVKASFAGYKPNEPITLQWDSDLPSPKTIGTTTADATGKGSITFRVPAAAVRGWHVLKGKGAQGSSATAEFRVLPRLKLSVSSGPRGTDVIISVWGFKAFEYVEVRWDPRNTYTVIGSFSCSSSGRGSKTVEVPSNARLGPRYIVAAGSEGSGGNQPFTVTST